MTKEPGKKPARSVLVEPEILEDQIRARAYELCEERGKEDGYALMIGYGLEADLKSRKHRSVAA